MALSNYSPTTSVFHNPTNVLDNKTYLDIHLIGAGTFVQNDFIYVKESEFTFLNNIILFQEWPELQYDYSNKLKSGFQNSDVQLISGAFQYKGHGFALTSRVRTFLDFRRVPTAVSKLIQNGTGGYEGLYDQVFNVDRMSVNQISYLEIGGTYSNAFYHFDHDLLAIGGSVKYLIGITGAAIELDELEFNVVAPSLTRIFKYKGRVSYASGFESGSGMGLDIGLMYKKTLSNVTYYNPFARNSACEPHDYKFKFGASIVDFGYVKFTKEATFIEIDADLSEAELNGDEFSFQNFGNFVKNQFVNVVEDNEFTLLTPTALNLQADYNFENYFFASLQYTHGFFRRIGTGVQRPHVLNISGRYERKWFEASLNGGLYSFNDFRTGLGLRIFYLTIGTDNLGSMLGISDFEGTDIYFNLRFFLTSKPGCKRKHKKSRRNETRCVKN
tara:strand:- start:1987 stop:3315 length:1329 start_codon:yes stop_codon:yes gene_type:complete